jgi:hypothetical protein
LNFACREILFCWHGWAVVVSFALAGFPAARESSGTRMQYQRKKDVVARSVAGENILVPVQGCTSSVYTLNPAGCRLWDLLEQERSEDELAGLLAEHYRISRETAHQDVAAFLQDMVRMGLVTGASPTGLTAAS